MQFITLASLYLLICTVLAQDVDWRDIPGICSPVCWAVVNLSQGCAHTVDDNGYINCVCNNNAAANWIPNCEACIAAVWRNDSGESRKPWPFLSRPDCSYLPMYRREQPSQ